MADRDIGITMCPFFGKEEINLLVKKEIYSKRGYESTKSFVQSSGNVLYLVQFWHKIYAGLI
jgi:hypothetical protein